MATGDIRDIEILGSAEWGGGGFARIGIEGLSTGGTYDFGLGTYNSPLTGTPKLTFNYTSYTFNNSLSAISDSRTVYGGSETRKLYPNEAVIEETAVVSPYTGVRVVVSLSDFIYSSDGSITCDVLSGFYTQGGTPNNAASGFAVTNNSDGVVPKVVANWSMVPFDQVGEEFKIRCTAFHRSSNSGEPVKYVKFKATNGVTERSYIIEESSIDPNGSTEFGDKHAVIEWIATFDATDTAFWSNGDTITCNFEAYGHQTNSGGTLGVLKTDDAVNTQPTVLYAPVTFRLRKDDARGYTVVDPTSGNDGTGTVYSSQSSAESGNAFQTHAAAMTAMQAYNNSTFSRNEAGGGVILCTEDTHLINSANGGTLSTWVELKPTTGSSKSNVIVQAATTNSAIPTYLKFNGVTVSGTNYFRGTNTKSIWWNDCDVNTTGSLTVWETPHSYVTNTTGTFARHFRTFSTSKTDYGLIRGCNMDVSHQSYGINILASQSIYVTGYEGGSTTNDGGIYAFNSLYDSGNITMISDLFRNYTALHGYACIQNLYENTATVSTPSIQFGADSSTYECNNIIIWHNTCAGDDSTGNGRCNFGYNDNATGTPPYPRRNWSQRGNIFIQWNNKGDVFASNANCYGNFLINWNIGTWGCLHVDAASASFRGYFDGYATSWGGTIAFVDDQSSKTTNNGNGDYHLQNTSDALNILPAEFKCLKWDIDGDARVAAPNAGALAFLSSNPSIQKSGAGILMGVGYGIS